MMNAITVFDPPMCCATGICGADVDQRLVDFAADLDWLKAQGVPVRRINLSQEPAEFVANGAIHALMQASDGEDLPALVVEGGIVSKGRYPSRAELAAWTGVAVPAPLITERVRELIALGAAIGASCEPCLKYHVRKARDLGLSEADMREAIAVGRMVKEASAKNILALADKLLPIAGPASSGCCGTPASAMPATPEAGGCGADDAAEPPGKRKMAGSCC